jgi:uncharacterized protein YndB with AHSA1/START domain
VAELTITRVFDAPPELVWQAWTDPVQIAQWWGPRGVTTPLDRIHLELRVGGAVEMMMIDDATGDEYPVRGTFVEVVTPERLVWRDEGFPDGTGAGVVTVTFADVGGKTQLTVHAVADYTDEVRRGAEIGWGTMLEKLAEHLASR